MKTLRPILLALTAVAALSVACPAKANLVTNPGFETGDFTGWTQGGDTSFTGVGGTFDSIAPHSGSFQAEMGNVNTGFLSQMLALAVGTTYSVDFWLANNFTGTNSFAASLGGFTGFSLTNGAASGYTEHTFDFTYTGGSTQLLFTFSQPNTVGFWLLDDVSVNAVGTVPDGGTTVSLLGCALLGLAGLRRKLGC